MREVRGWMQWSFRGGAWAYPAAGDFWLLLSADYSCCLLRSMDAEKLAGLAACSGGVSRGGNRPMDAVMDAGCLVRVRP
jgi:hypothetical protein